jgi:hypothetical protein
MLFLDPQVLANATMSFLDPPAPGSPPMRPNKATIVAVAELTARVAVLAPVRGPLALKIAQLDALDRRVFLAYTAFRHAGCVAIWRRAYRKLHYACMPGGVR